MFISSSSSSSAEEEGQIVNDNEMDRLKEEILLDVDFINLDNETTINNNNNNNHHHHHNT